MDEIRADYEALEQIAQRFASQADAIGQTLQLVTGRMQTLQGTWKGRGSNAFFAEMGDEVLPAVNRLYEALAEAARTTGQIAQTLRQAEEEAAGLFRHSQ